MRLTYNSGTKNIRFDHFSRFKLQVQTPKWSFENGDYYLMLPTVLRMFNDVKDGFGAGAVPDVWMVVVNPGQHIHLMIMIHGLEILG